MDAVNKSLLLEEKEIARRLHGLKEGFATNAIEGNPLTDKEKSFLEALVKKGVSSGEILSYIKKGLKIES